MHEIIFFSSFFVIRIGKNFALISFFPNSSRLKRLKNGWSIEDVAKVNNRRKMLKGHYDV